MKIGPALIGLGLLTVFYIGALVYIDRENHVFEHGVDLAAVLPQAALFALVSFILRYVRWRWLLGRRDFRFPWIWGLLAYVSGFTLTASPGKAGELVRVRYFGPMGVPADQVITCFVFERMLDLVAVLLLSILLDLLSGWRWPSLSSVSLLSRSSSCPGRRHVGCRWRKGCGRPNGTVRQGSP
jgi:hypothetical protein